MPNEQKYGLLAERYGEKLSLAVYKSNAGYYIGTYSFDGPFSRESEEYFSSREIAEAALKTNAWTQRENL